MRLLPLEVTTPTPLLRTTTRVTLKARIPMEPSSGSGNNRAGLLRMHASASGNDRSTTGSNAQAAAMQETIQNVPPIPCPDEPNLFYLPAQLDPTYRPLPLVVRLSVWLLAATVSALSTWRQRLSWLAPIVALQSGNWSGKKLLGFVVKTALIGVGSSVVLQDVFLPPSRVSMTTLRETYFLPSKLSRYEPLQLPNATDSIGVHYLEYKQPPKFANPTYAYQALFVNHGFGASSLSWLPALPALVRRTNARIGLGHDAVGFGFTQRPRLNSTSSLTSFTSSFSSQIGCALLKIKRQADATATAEPVVLMGHSMGAMTTLRMALNLDPSIPKRIILVAPALGISQTGAASTPTTTNKKKKKKKSSLFSIVPCALYEIPAAYVLRRLVGRRGFWRKGLRLAWGDPARLSASDVLRFEWPSVGKGWERGLIRFARAQSQASDMSDVKLMQRVLALPNTTIDVIVGAKDRVISSSQVCKFFGAFPQVSVVELPGLGHDPFEEDVDTFVKTVEDLLRASHQ